jgi:hypothetical protein
VDYCTGLLKSGLLRGWPLVKRARFYKRGILYSAVHLKSGLIKGWSLVKRARFYKRGTTVQGF